VLLLAIACRSGPEGPSDPAAVRSIAVSLAASRIAVGSTVVATAVLRNGAGTIVEDRLPVWSSLNPGVATVEPNGVITGVGVGTATIRAATGSVSTDAQIVVVNPVAATVTLSRDTASIAFPTGSLQLLATVRDAAGNVITRPDITWSSATPLVARVSTLGLVTPVAGGTAVIRATMDSASAQTVVNVQVALTGNAPTITAIAPSATFIPGGSYTLTGTNFAAGAANNTVLIDGLQAVVGAASTTQMVITVPSSGFPCEPTHQAFVQITANGATGGGSATLQVANTRTLQPGQSVVLSNLSDVRCNEIALTGGRYVVSVYNASRASISPTALGAVSATLRGATTIGGGQVALASGAARNVAAPAIPAAAPGLALRTAADARIVTHLATLERNRGMLSPAPRTATLRESGVLLRTARKLSSLTTAASTTVGAISPVKLPNLDAPNFCATSIPINARTVFVGQRAVILEDTATVSAGRATLAGQMDDYYRRLGQEFDATVWPLITSNFGDPLAFDAQVGGVGRVVMVFSPRINAMQQQTVQGFAVSCDLDLTQPSSNAGAFFYAIVPTSTAAGYANGETRDSWLRQLRGTVVHEVKHIAAFAERRSRGLSLDPLLTDISWEEGMARLAEELYARTFYQSPLRADLRYAATIGCDLTFQTVGSACQNRPVLMQRHFEALFGALATSQTLSPLGRATSTDVSFYASAWSVLRWAADHYSVSEAQFLSNLTLNNATGVLALEARTPGHSWEEILGEWSLAMYLDNLPGFTPENVRLSFPSWNLRNMFYGLCSDLGPCTTPTNPVNQFPRPIPQQPRAFNFGNFSSPVASVVGGGYVLFDIGGTQTARQLLELKGPNGADPPSTMRIAIVRVQ
jgi:hypothetical protein